MNFPEKEHEVLKKWEQKDIFKKTLEKQAPKGSFVFYEGPPTANGKPGIHHAESRAFKDCIPRFKTMQGYKVVRKAGWDTHGLPVELEVENNLALKVRLKSKSTASTSLTLSAKKVFGRTRKIGRSLQSVWDSGLI